MHPLLWQTDFFSLLPFPWSLHTYGLLIAIGFLFGMSMAKDQAVREGLDGEQIVDLTFYLLLWGLIGGRVVFILTQLSSFMADPIEIFMFWRGGLVWYGGFLGAVGYLSLYTRRHKLAFFQIVDILILPTALAHAFGRLGCLAAGCCFGSPTQLPWGIVFPAGSMAQQAQAIAGKVMPLASSLPIHPTQLYEASAEFLLFLLLAWMRPRKRYHGQLFLLWLSAYPVLRSFIEVFRGDTERGVYILSTSQYISIGVGLLAFVMYWQVRKTAAAAAPASAPLS